MQSYITRIQGSAGVYLIDQVSLDPYLVSGVKLSLVSVYCKRHGPLKVVATLAITSTVTTVDGIMKYSHRMAI